jgi:hypothetical protein
MQASPTSPKSPAFNLWRIQAQQGAEDDMESSTFGELSRTRSVPTWGRASDDPASDDVPSSGGPVEARDYFPKSGKQKRAIKPTIGKAELPKAPVSPRPEDGAAEAVPKGGAAKKKTPEVDRRKAELLLQQARQAKGLAPRECKGEESPVCGGKQ